MPRHRILFVEDEDGWKTLLSQVARKEDFGEFEFRKDAVSARKAIVARPVHIASLDQNIPAVPGEKPMADYGFLLLAEICDSRPFVRTLMYTAHGQVKFANRAGRLQATEYFEKPLDDKKVNAVDIPDYFKLLRIFALGGTRADTGASEPPYWRWAMARGRAYLPGMLGNAAGQLHDACKDIFDSAKAADALSALTERTAHLAWAQACALAQADKRKPPRRTDPPADLFGLLDVAKVLWRDLGDELGVWHGYITASSPDKKDLPTGQRLSDALDRLGKIRNDVSHHTITLSAADLDKVGDELLALTDGLAYWADRPLMANVRYHPDDNSRLQFTKLVAPPSWPVADLISSVSLLSTVDRGTSIQFLHRTEKAERLIDMFPFASMVARPGKLPTPCLLLPRRNGCLRRSLDTGEEISDAPLTARERDGINSFFGGGWAV